MNRACYKAQIAQLFAFDCARHLADGGEKPRPRVVCENEREYLSAVLHYIMKLFASLREDRQFFSFFVGLIDADNKLGEADLDSLAEDIIFLLFTDFGSCERSYMTALRHFDCLLPVRWPARSVIESLHRV